MILPAAEMEDLAAKCRDQHDALQARWESFAEFYGKDWHRENPAIAKAMIASMGAALTAAVVCEKSCANAVLNELIGSVGCRAPDGAS